LPFGYIPFDYRGSDGLVLKAGSQDVMISVPEQDNMSELIEYRYVLSLGPDGSLAGDGSETFHGAFAAQLDERYDNLNDAEIKQRVEAGINNTFPGATVEWTSIPSETPVGSFELKSYFKHPNFVEVVDGVLELPALLPTSSLSAYASFPNRSLPVHIRRPIINQGNVEVALPEGFIWDVETKEVKRETPFGTYALSISIDSNNVLKIQRSHNLPNQMITPEAYPEFLEFVAFTNKHKDISIRAHMQ